MHKHLFPKHLQVIENQVFNKVKLVKSTSSELYEPQQLYRDKILKVYREAFENLISSTVTYSNILKNIKKAYEDAIEVRDKRITQLVIQDRVFGISDRKNVLEENIITLSQENENLKDKNIKLTLEISKLKTEIGKLTHEEFSEYLALAHERDARYTLYCENVALHLKLRALDGSASPVAGEDPVVLRVALDRCRLVTWEQLSTTQRDLMRKNEEYAETVPFREYDALVTKLEATTKQLNVVTADLQALQEMYTRVLAKKKGLEEELAETKDRCTELERAGTPRPQWQLCADFIGGGRDRWRQLASGLSSRDTLRVLLKELGPAAESDHLEHFDGLGLDPSIPPYLRYEGQVRNLRLSRREIRVIINDIWRGRRECSADITMQDYVTKYFKDRYQQPSVRAEWAYNLCAGAEQMLDEPQVKLFWGVLHSQLAERIYWGLRDQWQTLKDNLYRHAKAAENVSIEEFEKISRATFPLKSEVDIKNLSDVVRKQLKIKINSNEVSLDKLLQENEEGFERVDLAKELYRQRQAAQDKYIREVVAALGGRRARAKPVTVDALKRAFAIVDPAIDHIRMERYIRWAFSSGEGPLTLRALVARLAAGDIERVGPRARGPYSHRH